MADAPILSADEALSLKVLGFLYLKLGFFDRAARLFQALASMFSGDAGIAKSLCLAFLESGKAEEALRLVPADAQADPDWLLLKARALQKQGRAEEAAQAMDACLSLGNAKPLPEGAGA